MTRENPSLRTDRDKTAVRRAVRRHVAFAWFIASLLAVFVFAYAINLPAS
jgi:hypothetical protein